MSSETALTGRYGHILVDAETIARLTEWSVNPKLAHTSEWGDSDSAGGTNRAAGRQDCLFSAAGKFDTESYVFNLFYPGDICEVYLYMGWGSESDSTGGYPASDNWAWHFVRALCMDFKLTVNVDTEEVIGWTSDWGEDGGHE